MVNQMALPASSIQMVQSLKVFSHLMVKEMAGVSPLMDKITSFIMVGISMILS